MLWLSEVQAVCCKYALKLTAAQLRLVLQMAQQCDSACEVEELVQALADNGEPCKANTSLHCCIVVQHSLPVAA